MRRARLLLALTALAVALLVPVPAYAQRTIALSSGSFGFKVSPGKGGKGEVVVMNDGDESINVLVYVADQTVDETGKVDFVTPNRDSLQGSLSGPSSWVRIEMPERSKAVGNTPYVVLEPGEDVPVKFSFEVPADTPSGDHNTILFFEMFSLDDASQGTTSKVYGRVGSRLKVRVDGPMIERLDAAPFWVDGFVIGDTVPFRFTLQNAGNIDKRLNAHISLLDRSEAERFGSQVATDAAVYAGTQRQMGGEIVPGGQLLGRFTARLRVDYQLESGENPGPTSIVKERTVWIVPLWFAIGGTALFAVFALWIIWRMAMRSARRRMRKQRERSLRARSDRESARGAIPDDGNDPAPLADGTEEQSRPA